MELRWRRRTLAGRARTDPLEIEANQPGQALYCLFEPQFVILLWLGTFVLAKPYILAFAP